MKKTFYDREAGHPIKNPDSHILPNAQNICKMRVLCQSKKVKHHKITNRTAFSYYPQECGIPNLRKFLSKLNAIQYGQVFYLSFD